MASAGRILIIPKGSWDEQAEYTSLDLVNHNGASWIAKKTASGIEPSEANNEWWQKIADIGFKADFKEVDIVCVIGDNDYSIDLSEYNNQTIIGTIHWLGYPLSTEFSHATLFQKNHNEGCIHCDAGDTYRVKCVIIYE
jgi:hypothetical protein